MNIEDPQSFPTPLTDEAESALMLWVVHGPCALHSPIKISKARAARGGKENASGFKFS